MLCCSTFLLIGECMLDSDATVRADYALTTSYTVLAGNSAISKNEGTSLWNFVPNSGKILLRYIAQERWTLRA